MSTRFGDPWWECILSVSLSVKPVKLTFKSNFFFFLGLLKFANDKNMGGSLWDKARVSYSEDDPLCHEGGHLGVLTELPPGCVLDVHSGEDL